jgi:hexosaminidase
VWGTLLGCNEAGFGSNRSACEEGLRWGAGGILNTDWGDGGHWQYQPASYVPFAAGAAMAWCGATNPEDGFRRPLDTHVFRDESRAMADAVLALADAWEKVGRGITQAHTFDHILRGGRDIALPQGVTAETLGEAEAFISTAVDRIGSSRMRRPDADLIVDEFRNGARMAIHACRRGQAILGKPLSAATLAADARELLAEHRRLWLARNRPGGLADSCRRFEELVAEYRAAG